MGTSIAWVQMALAALCLLTLVVAFGTTVRLRAVSQESATLGESDTKTVVKLRLLESRVSELVTKVAELERSQGFTASDREGIDLRAALASRKRDVPNIVRVPEADWMETPPAAKRKG